MGKQEVMNKHKRGKKREKPIRKQERQKYMSEMSPGQRRNKIEHKRKELQ